MPLSYWPEGTYTTSTVSNSVWTNSTQTTTSGSTLRYVSLVSYITTDATSTSLWAQQEAWRQMAERDLQRRYWSDYLEADAERQWAMQEEVYRRTQRQHPSPPVAAPAIITRRTIEAQEAEIVRRHREEAKERAMTLLLSFLNDHQRLTLKEKGYFDVQGGITGRRYRIHAVEHLVANVAELSASNDNEVRRLCAHCDKSTVPLGDQLLAQKVFLEFDEQAFLRTANIHHPRIVA